MGPAAARPASYVPPVPLLPSTEQKKRRAPPRAGGARLLPARSLRSSYGHAPLRLAGKIRADFCGDQLAAQSPDGSRAGGRLQIIVDYEQRIRRIDIAIGVGIGRLHAGYRAPCPEERVQKVDPVRYVNSAVAVGIAGDKVAPVGADRNSNLPGLLHFVGSQQPVAESVGSVPSNAEAWMLLPSMTMTFATGLAPSTSLHGTT